jgi:hypothetical protein
LKSIMFSFFHFFDFVHVPWEIKSFSFFFLSFSSLLV